MRLDRRRAATAEWRAGGTAENAALLHRLKILKLAAGGAPFLFGGAEPAPSADLGLRPGGRVVLRGLVSVV
jgi:hypothetical protein